MTISFRKGKNGDWAVMGPVSEMKIGTVQVKKKDGSITPFEITELGPPFEGDEGVMCVYGYRMTKVEKENGKEGIPKKRKCVLCEQEFTYGDCKRSEGNWKGGYCGC